MEDSLPTAIENERRFLIKRIPGVADWPVKFTVSRIKQVYLENPDKVERVRQQTWRDGDRMLTHNTKVPLGPGSNQETEESITENAFRTLLQRADPERDPILKARMVFMYGDRIWELDEVFTRHLNILEIELDDLNEDLEFPPWLEITREITGEDEFSNFAMSRKDWVHP